MSLLRKDPVSNQWVIVSEGRSLRPSDFERAEENRPVGNVSASCAFCPGNEGLTPPELLAIPGGDHPWRVRVFANKYPAVTADHAPIGPDAFYDERPAVGHHEVIVESPIHNHRLSQLDADQWLAVLGAYRKRLAHHQNGNGSYTLLFKNEGRRAGASLLHPHAQVMTLPLVPDRISAEWHNAQQHQRRHGKNLFAQLVGHELSSGQRLVGANDLFVVFVPFAARFPYEMHLVPRFQSADFAETDAASLSACGMLLGEALGRLDALLGAPPFNMVLHTAPPACSLQGLDGLKDSYRWHFEIAPRLTTQAGFEIGGGMAINPVAPENAARALASVKIDTPLHDQSSA